MLSKENKEQFENIKIKCIDISAWKKTLKGRLLTTIHQKSLESIFELCLSMGINVYPNILKDRKR
jgi:hypothetical protein